MSLSATSDERADATAAHRSVAFRAAGSVPWVLLAVAAQRVLGSATNLVLAWLLTPADFGLVSFSMVVIGASKILEDLGVPAAIIYGGRDARVVGGTALTINVAAGLLLFAAIALASPLLASLGGHEEIASIVTVLALSLVISSFGSLQNALLVRELAFRRRLVPEVVPVVGASVISIGLALMGFGVWSLVYGNLARAALATLILWRLSSIRPWPEFKWDISRELLRYGGHISFASIVTFVLTNVDYFIIGHMLGMSALGIYTLAFVVASLPVNAVSQQIVTVAFPAYSRLKTDTASLFRLFEDVFSTMCLVTVPLATAIVLCVPAYATTVLGQKWAGIAEPLLPLVAFGVLRSVNIHFAPLYKAMGRPDVVWKLALLRLVILVPLMLWLIREGVVGVAISQVVVASLFFPVGLAFVARLTAIPIARLWHLAWPPLTAAAVMLGVLAAASSVPGLSAITASFAGPMLTSGLAAIVYGLTFLAICPRMTVLARMGLGRIRMVRGQGAA